MTVPLPPSTGYSGQAVFAVASVPANLQLTISYANHPPTGVSALSTMRQTASAKRTVLDASSTNVVYGCFAANYVLDINGAPQFSFTLPPGFANRSVAYNLAIEQGGKWTTGYGGPGTIDATTTSATVGVNGRFGFTIPAKGSVCVALYGRSTTAPTPVPATPAPSATPSSDPTASPTTAPTTTPTASPSSHPTTTPTTAPTTTPTTSPSAHPTTTPTAAPTTSPTTAPTTTPTTAPTTNPTTAPTTTPTTAPTTTPTTSPTAAPLTISSATLSLLGLGSSLAQSASVLETGYTGTFSIAATSCANIATVSPSTGSGPALALTVTGLAAGTCTATATDTNGQTASLTITVTVSNLHVNAIERKP